MPLLFSYGTLQNADVQLATFGRRLEGGRDALVGGEPSSVPIDDPAVASRLGMTHHANVTFTGEEAARVPGMAFEVTDAELVRVDEYEAPFAYRRRLAPLQSGREAWVYVHDPAPSAPETAP